MKKLSIITAVHNQIEYNRLFLESIEENTFNPYDLIIIDNASHDGSGRLFSGPWRNGREKRNQRLLRLLTKPGAGNGKHKVHGLLQ